ncbi:hypothetical protein EVAR_21253_1 [Eumeta japonica]|uniref:Uncharacterized protein n=1 Tax=Eumeta variegata TaxID=151549 RepID=A0A4C1WM70_EUMVA|nr:hypothetical protein EVAR_21253_1 [Eumeta japonica]
MLLTSWCATFTSPPSSQQHGGISSRGRAVSAHTQSARAVDSSGAVTFPLSMINSRSDCEGSFRKRTKDRQRIYNDSYAETRGPLATAPGRPTGTSATRWTFSATACAWCERGAWGAWGARCYRSRAGGGATLRLRARRCYGNVVFVIKRIL